MKCLVSTIDDRPHGEAPHLWLAVDMPFWWDKDNFILEFEGNSKRFNEHVQDLTDFIVVMSYRRSTQQVLSCVENEWSYAKQINKVIFTSLETIKLKQDQHISFWGLPVAEFWNIVPQLLETAKGDPAMGGVMIHCYRSLVEKLNNNNLKVRGRRYPVIIKTPLMKVFLRQAVPGKKQPRRRHRCPDRRLFPRIQSSRFILVTYGCFYGSNGMFHVA